MKLILYVVVVLLSGCIVYLTSEMSDRPFNSANMRSAYFHGCNLGLHSPLTVESVARCNKVADLFKGAIDEPVRER